MLFVGIIIVLGVGTARAAPAAGTCLCVTGSSVHYRDHAGTSSHVYGSMSHGECYKFNGGVLTKDGYTWYELQDVHGHHRAWAASNYLHTSSSSHCSSGGSTGGGGTSSHTFATGMVSQHCMDCICKLESGCSPNGCHFDVNSDSCGYFQIKQGYWEDCGRLGGSWHACADNLDCASRCVQAYIKRYIGFSGCSHSCESYARIHNGGPKGCQHSSTLGYWGHIHAKGCSAHS